MHDIDLRSLEIFRAVAHEGSVTRAAAKLNRVQSNISTRIRQLEDRLQKALFLRRNRRLTLTPDGRLLLQYAERLLQLTAEAEEALNGAAPTGPFRIGAMESTAAARLPAILSRYHADHPDVALEVETDVAAGLLAKLQDHEIDAAFIAEPVEAAGVESQPVFEEALVLLTPASYPPLEDPSGISGKTIVAFEQGCAYRAYLERWVRDAGVAPASVISVGSYLAILACVSAGTGYAVAPKSVLDAIASDGDFRRTPLPPPYDRIRTLLCWRAGDGSAKLEALKRAMP